MDLSAEAAKAAQTLLDESNEDSARLLTLVLQDIDRTQGMLVDCLIAGPCLVQDVIATLAEEGLGENLVRAIADQIVVEENVNARSPIARQPVMMWSLPGWHSRKKYEEWRAEWQWRFNKHNQKHLLAAE